VSVTYLKLSFCIDCFTLTLISSAINTHASFGGLIQISNCDRWLLASVEPIWSALPLRVALLKTLGRISRMTSFCDLSS
jgi:hypothetical protein